MEEIIVENLTFRYAGSEDDALKDINLTVKEGEFILIAGPSGCGKSTLIRLINRLIPDYYGGTIEGEVYLKGHNIENMKREEIVKSVGMVFQHPEKQIVFQEVEREIAFGLENLNTDLSMMKRNVAEAISLLGINSIRSKQTNEISGGQKQKIAIASVISMNPDILLFDEPVSQLDPISAEEVLDSILKLNRDLGKTIILVEQRLDKCFSIADRIIFMENGRIVGEGNSSNIPQTISKRYHLPNIAYIFHEAGCKRPPSTVKTGRCMIEKMTIKSHINEEVRTLGDIVLNVKKLGFEYERGIKTLKNVTFELHKNEILAVMGENGAGKSTLFKIISGIIERYSGDVSIGGVSCKRMPIAERIKKIGYLSQNPNDYFGRKTVFDEVAYTLKNLGEYNEAKVNSIIDKLGLSELKDRNPRDLSGGEKQRVGIAATIVSEPDIIILDEPTRGMDAQSKHNLGLLLQELSLEGKAIVLITHDADFAGDYADTVMLMFDGEITAHGRANDIMCGSIYYSPQITKVFGKRIELTKGETAIEILRENLHEKDI